MEVIVTIRVTSTIKGNPHSTIETVKGDFERHLQMMRECDEDWTEGGVFTATLEDIRRAD